MGAVVEGSLPEVQPAHPNNATVGNDERALRSTSRSPRRNFGSAVIKLIARLWIPLVVLAVIGAGGFTVSRLHGIFGSERPATYGDTRINDSKPFNPKHMRYEVFGAPGTVAQISFFDENGSPQYIKAAPLPWTLEFPIAGAAGVGSVAAQGDTDNIGCRILIDGVVKAEKTSSEVAAFTSCMLKAA